MENPDGQRFRVRCFSRADDLVTTTNLSSEWSWFPGYQWQTQACAGCGGLAGWKFRREDQVFFALIS